MDRDLPPDFNPDDFEEYPPGRALPDDLPIPLRAMLLDMHRRGLTVRVGKPDETGAITGAIVEGVNAERLFDMEQTEHTVKTPGHKQNCECLTCQANAKLQKVNQTDQLNVDEKLEAATKIAMDFVQKAQDENETPQQANMLLNAQRMMAVRKNRRWFVEQVQARMAENLRALTKRQALPPLTEEATVQEKLERLGQETGSLFLVQDLAGLLEVLTSGKPQLEFLELAPELANE
jgi:hypothetical protein